MRMPAAVLSLLVAFQLSGAELHFSGVLGQSQEPGAEPLPCIAMRGAAFDDSGRLYSFLEDGRNLCRFSNDGMKWRLAGRFEAPVYLGKGTLQSAAGKLVFPGSDGNVYAFDPASDVFSKLFPLPKDSVSFQLAPSVFGKGWRCLSLTTSGAMARGLAQDSAWIKLFNVGPSEKGSKPEAIGIEPSSGDVLVGYYWPDMYVRRFSVDGKELVTPSWPRTRVPAKLFSTIDSMAWALCSQALPVWPGVPKESGKGELPWTMWTNGLGKDKSGSFWLSCSQGVLGLDSKLSPLKKRIGGLPEAKLLAAAPDGSLLAYSQGRMVRLMMDGPEDAPPLSAPNEPFRVGANWQSDAVAMQFDGCKFMVLDGVKRQLWAFDLWHTGWREDTWLPFCPEGSFKNPKSLAVGLTKIYVLDGARLLSSGYESGGVFEEPFPGRDFSKVSHIAAVDDARIVCVEGSQLSMLSLSPRGLECVWKSQASFTEISAIAVSKSFVAVSDGFGGKISALSLTDGSLLASIDSNSVPGGMAPSGIAISGPWVFVSDSQGMRILRFRLR